MINLVLAITSPYMERFLNTDIFVHLNEAVYHLQDLSPKLSGEGHIDLSIVKKKKMLIISLVQAITFLSLEGFSNILACLFALMRRYSICKTQFLSNSHNCWSKVNNFYDIHVPCPGHDNFSLHGFCDWMYFNYGFARLFVDCRNCCLQRLPNIKM